VPRYKHDLGIAASLNAAAIGEPGSRRFHLTLEAEKGSARVWMEKQQLFQLGIGIDRLLAALGGLEAPEHESEGTISPREGLHLECQAGKLFLGQADQPGLFLLGVLDSDDEGDAIASEDEYLTLVALVSRNKIKEFGKEALEVCAAGRPLCPLCNSPIGPEPHVCPKSNGHLKLV